MRSEPTRARDQSAGGGHTTMNAHLSKLAALIAEAELVLEDISREQEQLRQKQRAGGLRGAQLRWRPEQIGDLDQSPPSLKKGHSNS